jgi:hypothetical protein
MTVATSLIPGLDEIVRRGDPRRRSDVARAIADLFFQDASKLRPDLVDLFDNLLIDVVPHADLPARIDLAERFSRDRAIWSASSRARTKFRWRVPCCVARRCSTKRR